MGGGAAQLLSLGQPDVMKILKFIVGLTVTVASFIGAFVSFDMVSDERFNKEPNWLQDILLGCLIICPIAALFSFIYGYYQIQQGRKLMSRIAEDAKDTRNL
jgi:hypothetical protein